MKYELNVPSPNVKSYLKGSEILLRYAANKNKTSNLPAVLIWLLLGTASFLYFSSHGCSRLYGRWRGSLGYLLIWVRR